MLNLLKRVVGELFILSILIEFAYFLLLGLEPLSFNQRLTVISFILTVLAYFITRFYRQKR